MATLWQLMAEHIPDDHSRQVHSQYYLEEELTGPDSPPLVVDLGCGNGASALLARKWRSDVQWVGVDILQSDYAKGIEGEQVLFYDGVNLPFADNSIPLIYSNQVFEHVRHPEPLLREIARVLQPGGLFIGSTSQLEPYHAWSLWNYTIYGFKVLVSDAGMELTEVRPGIDGIALMHRQWFGRRPEHGSWFQRSPLNTEIDEWGVATKRRAALVNLRKLQFCGQFSFRVQKPGGPPRVRTPRKDLAKPLPDPNRPAAGNRPSLRRWARQLLPAPRKQN
ncbi:class I SAM-dependent methyltransferase [Plantactinospora sp. S1510]|uniref:Class I SAM-dependent methyltransferase n=1 Tax=Plantactinospora alkalitolerans TaxID=2789879 RepID=A0ABS0H5T5_9ACTN|nr:class I SAM-dependent methyltransferase [Plantactinospora alkalitolerans]MBF9133826.1 class I SAM-dependent methyltransferase [Plantactinospora alkalitolerans]